MTAGSLNSASSAARSSGSSRTSTGNATSNNELHLTARQTQHPPSNHPIYRQIIALAHQPDGTRTPSEVKVPTISGGSS
jgi:hypothetical protein